MSETTFRCSRTVCIFISSFELDLIALLFISNIHHHQCISNCVNRFYVRLSNLLLRLSFFYLSLASGSNSLRITKDKVNPRSAKIELSLFKYSIWCHL